jgi:hypothetical protein
MPLALLPLHPHEDLLPFQQKLRAVLIVQSVQPATEVREHGNQGHFRHCCLLYRFEN